MKILLTAMLRIAIAFASLAMSGVVALAEPAAPMRVVVPWPPGGVVDMVVRMVGPELSAGLKRDVVVVNKPGAGGTVGGAQVAHAPADGSMWLATSSAIAMNQALMGNRLPFNFTQDLTPVAGFAAAPQVIIVSPKSSFHTVQSLITYAKAHPGQLNYASAGVGSPAHLGSELLKTMAHADIKHIPYQGSPAALMATISGDVAFFMSPVPVALPLIRSGRVRAIAVTGAQRSPSLPDIPTVAESGYPGFEASQWIGLFAPKGTPPEMRKRVADAAVHVIEQPAFRKKLVSAGVDTISPNTNDFSEMVTADLRRWSQLVTRAGIQIN